MGAFLNRKEIGISRALIDEEHLQKRITELARIVDSWYPESTPVLVGVLNGAAVFMTELMQAMSIPVSVDFMAVSSYGTSTQSSGVVQILKDLSIVDRKQRCPGRRGYRRQRTHPPVPARCAREAKPQIDPGRCVIAQGKTGRRPGVGRSCRIRNTR